MRRPSHLRLVGPGERMPAKTLRLEDLSPAQLAAHDANVLFALLDGSVSVDQAQGAIGRAAAHLARAARAAQTPPSEAAVEAGDLDSPPVA